MFLSTTIRNIGRSCSSSVLNQQFNKLNSLAPISSYHHHFHRNEDETSIKRRTGLTGFVNNYSNLHRAIHSNNALYLKYSNLLGQKVAPNENKIGQDDNKTTSGSPVDPNLEALEEVKKLGLFARFKRMAKDYWYVLIPVHVVTSGIWLGAFYYTSKR